MFDPNDKAAALLRKWGETVDGLNAADIERIQVAEKHEDLVAAIERDAHGAQVDFTEHEYFSGLGLEGTDHTREVDPAEEILAAADAAADIAGRLKAMSSDFDRLMRDRDGYAHFMAYLDTVANRQHIPNPAAARQFVKVLLEDLHGNYMAAKASNDKDAMTTFDAHFGKVLDACVVADAVGLFGSELDKGIVDRVNSAGRDKGSNRTPPRS